MKEIFSMFDKNGDGTISTTDLKKVFDQVGIKISDADLAALITKLDKNTDGTISYTGKNIK